jgi:hypothetical protein
MQKQLKRVYWDRKILSERTEPPEFGGSEKRVPEE